LSEDALAKELTDYALGRCVPLGIREWYSIRQKIVLFCKDARYLAGIWVLQLQARVLCIKHA